MATASEDKKEVTPAANSAAKEVPETAGPAVEAGEEGSEEAVMEEELKALESQDQPAPKPQRTELDKAVFSARSTLKRIKDLGGNPAELLKDDEPEPEAERPAADSSQFVTKTDLARSEAQKIAKSPTELRLIMWYVENKGMSVEDAHFMANKGRIRKVLSEVDRTRSAVPAAPGGGAGHAAPEKKESVPELPESEKRRLAASGMTYDPSKKAYVGRKVQLRYDEARKDWVTERI